VGAGPLRSRSGTAVTVTLQINKLWVQLGNLIVANTQAFGDAGSEIMDQYVGLLDQREDNLFTRFTLQINTDCRFPLRRIHSFVKKGNLELNLSRLKENCIGEFGGVLKYNGMRYQSLFVFYLVNTFFSKY